MANVKTPRILIPITVMITLVCVLGLAQALSAEDELESLIKKIPTKVEHGESGSAHYKLKSLKMNGVKHKAVQDEAEGPPSAMWPPRPGRRNVIPNQWGYYEPGSPRPGRRTLQDLRKVRLRPGRAHIPQKQGPINPFGTKTRPGRNAEGDLPWEYTGNSLQTGESKESHTFKQVAPQNKRNYHQEQLELQQDYRL